ncbi:hypothetical protein PVK06_030739 [Gossypium arboreum]|uniref:Uncharacterized protein n=1 Tax=Gossypium arboreum TaxID=29729 RepID=A0ABR0NP29_GOSAR|nr:hypothetical protein PVK06_030739 [Gossypium arboreum]
MVDGASPSSTIVAANAGIEVEVESPTTWLYGQKHLYRVAINLHRLAIQCSFVGHIGYKRTNNFFPLIEFDDGTSNPLVEDDNEDVAEEEDTTKEERAADVLEVGMKYPDKDTFLPTLKWYNFKNGVNYHIRKSCLEKFKGKSAIRDERFKWKISETFWKKMDLWMIKKHASPHTCVTPGVSQDHPRLVFDMIFDIILPMVKVSPRIPILVLTANIYSQNDYTPSYCKA